MGMGRDLMEIAMAFLGIAVLTLLIGQASKTATVVQSTAGAFDMLLKTVTLQNSGAGGLSF